MRQKEENAALLKTIDRRSEEVDRRLIQAQVNLNAMDCAKMIAEEEKHLRELDLEKQSLYADMKELEAFQTKVSEMTYMLQEAGSAPAQQHILSALCESGRFSSAEKEAAVEQLKAAADEAYDRTVRSLGDVERKQGEIEDRMEKQIRIAEECRKHRNAYALIPDYVGLREEINQEFRKQGIGAEAQFACEYVIGLTDETWRDAVEAFLGARRYTILVDPEYYDIADDVLNRSKNRYAHLFNTKLLMQNSSTTYLEVLTARQSLLSAQLSQTANQFKEIQSLINLYQALGGGRNG